MRKLVGCLVLIAGVGGLGYVATVDHAVRIQSRIYAGAQAVATAARHDVQARVSGRDVTVSGLVMDRLELAALLADIKSISGVRLVDVSGIESLPVASPFALTVTRPADVPITLSGAVPSEATREALSADDIVADLTLAAGVPDGDWAGVAAQAIVAVRLLKSGVVTLFDREIHLTGVARDPDAVATALVPLDGLPDGYTLTSDLDVEDDGTPLRLTLSLLEGSVSGGGKLPADMEQSMVSSKFITGEIAIEQSVFPAEDQNWPEVVDTTIDALLLLTDGELEIQARDISLIGRGAPDDIAQAAEVLAGLPDGYDVTSDLSLWDDGRPFAMTLLWDGTTATAEGKFPAEFTPRGPAGVAVDTSADVSFLLDETGDFATNAAAGTIALGLLATGTLQMTAQEISLIGTAASPQVGIVMDSALANAAAGTMITRDIIYLDDGSPAAWTLSYAAATGAQIEGRLPVGLGVDDLSQGLGVLEVTGSPATALEDDSVGNSLEVLQIIATYLPEIENMTYAREGELSVLDLVLSSGVDLDLVAGDLAERLPQNLAFALSPLEEFPADGATRTNAATGVGEEFIDGFWLPNIDFESNADGCAVQSASVMERNQIGFLTGSARLDATSTRAMSALAAVVLPCVASGLTLEIGGHTDATGSEFDNIELSQARAEAVQSALIARGVPVGAITAYGFGQSQPIADNETPEGRAANRRTDITWYAPGALREP